MMRNFGVFASVLLTLGFVGYACTSGEVVDGPATGRPGNTTGTGTGNTTGRRAPAARATPPARGGTTGTGNTHRHAAAPPAPATPPARPARRHHRHRQHHRHRPAPPAPATPPAPAGTTGTGKRPAPGTPARHTTGTGNTDGHGQQHRHGQHDRHGRRLGHGGQHRHVPGDVRCRRQRLRASPGASGGCLHGYAFAGGDAGSTIMPKDFATCGTPCMLKMTGTVGAATAANSYAGVGYIGFSVGQESSGTPATLSPKARASQSPSPQALALCPCGFSSPRT